MAGRREIRVGARRARTRKPDQLEPPGSEELFDAIVAWGDIATVRDRVSSLIRAGADQVVLNLITRDRAIPYLHELRLLAPLNAAGV